MSDLAPNQIRGAPRKDYKSLSSLVREVVNIVASSSFKPRVILGLMTFGLYTEKRAQITCLDNFRQFFDYLNSNGDDEFDIAWIYLEEKQEDFTAAIGWKERGLSLASKVILLSLSFISPSFCRKISMSRWLLSKRDTLYMHAADLSAPFAETLEAVIEIYREGKFRCLDLSNYASFEAGDDEVYGRERGHTRLFTRPCTMPSMHQEIFGKLKANRLKARNIRS